MYICKNKFNKTKGLTAIPPTIEIMGFLAVVIMIDSHFKPITFSSLERELEELREQHHPYIEVACIIPFHYKKDIDSQEEILGMNGDVVLSSDKQFVYVYPSREFPSGKTNESRKICYCYPSDKFPELYSFDNITLEWRLAIAMGGIIDMRNPYRKLRYIYEDFKEE